MNKKLLTESKVELEDGSSFLIYHNLPDLIEAAIVNWEARTEEYTAESLCKYINSKRERGLTDHYAYTVEEFNNLK